MARFILMAGRYHRGRQKDNTRLTVTPGQAFDTVTQKEAEFCRKYPQNFQEVAPALPQYVGPVAKPGQDKPDEVEIDFDKLKQMNMRDLVLFCRNSGISTTALNKEQVLSDIEKFVKDNS